MGISLQNFNWGRFYAATDVECAWTILYDQVLLHANYYAPKKTVTMSSSHPPWYTVELLEHSIERMTSLLALVRNWIITSPMVMIQTV